MSKLLRAYDRSRVPLYLQVASVMRQRIEAGHWRPGQKISTLVELEEEFQVARVTVRQAVDMLSKDGLLDCQQGRGTFVSAGPPDRHWLKLETDWDVLVAAIKDNVVKRIKVDNPPAAPTLREGEGVLADDYVFLRSCQFRDGQPYGLVNVHLARHVFDRDPHEFTHRTALPTLGSLKDIGISHAHQTLVIGGASPETADHLHIALGAPTAECRCVVLDRDGVAIYVADISYRGDVIKLHVDLLANARATPAVQRSPGRRPNGNMQVIRS
jgi:GntR family transcriptional regulator